MIALLKRIKAIIVLIINSVEHIEYIFRYGHVGILSSIKKPIRVVGSKHIFVGNKTTILNGIRIEAIEKWNGKKYSPEIRIGNNVNFGQNCHVTCANKIIVGNGVSVMPQVLITDIEHEYIADKTLLETGLEVGAVEIGDYTVIGMGTRILGSRGVKIGRNVIVGTNSIIKSNIPDNSIAYGNPLKIVRRSEDGRSKIVEKNS